MFIDADAPCDTSLLVVEDEAWLYPDMGYDDGKSCAGKVGEKLLRVVGFGAFRESGGLVLGLSIGGESGRGMRFGRCCFVGPDETYMFPIGDVTVDGGESGIVIGGYELFRGLTGLDRSGLGRAGLDIASGVGGGDGVDDVDKNVGPWSVEAGGAVSCCR
jgi:hypothetical protein